MSDPSPVFARGVSVAIDARPVLRQVDLEVPPGQFVAVMGANGSGKSTLVRALVGLRAHQSGEIRLFGERIERFGDWHRIGFVPQRLGAGSGVPASVREVVTSGRIARRRPFARASAADRSAVEAAIDAVDLTAQSHEPVAALSGGQQQRVLIARALAAQADLYVLDEPTAGVDLPHQEALAGALTVLASHGATVLLVAHELGPMAPLVDRCVVMSNGRVAYDGPPLAEREVHEVHLGPYADGVHHHVHGRAPEREDCAPAVRSPLDLPAPGEGDRHG